MLKAVSELKGLYMKKYKLFDHYLKMKEKNIFLIFSGLFSDDIFSALIRKIQTVLSEKGEKPIIIKKIFSIFIELAQNIYFYSAEEKGEGIILIEDHKDFYRIRAGNLSGNADACSFKKEIEAVNRLSKKELRELYMKKLKSPSDPGKIGGNIGLLIAARKSGNPIDINICPVNREAESLKNRICSLLFSLFYHLKKTKFPKEPNKNWSFVEVSVKIDKNI